MINYIAEIGQGSLVIALILSCLQAILPTIGFYFNKSNLLQISRPLLWLQSFWVLIAFITLSYGFVIDDFSIKYIANNSNTNLPDIFKFSATWGAHEGSMLMWTLILSIWSVLVSIFSSRIPDKVIYSVISILGFISMGFIAFILFTSNPFEILSPAPLQGRELNPLLQDFGLIIHPPMLYMGYVGMSIPFAFAISALITGNLDSTWIRWSRPWTLVAWAFLTIGITLGSWWAYYELGWGGWWFWDPVENASFMPWIVATALVHSLIVSEKRGAFKHWTILLAISAFSLSLLGTFLVRSGVLTSVHSFASDPERGVFILGFLVLVVGFSLVLYAFRAGTMKSTAKFDLFSKETALLTNNILLVTAVLTVLLGTLYPLLLDALGLGKISVGAPYFNSVFIPIMIPAAILLAIAPLLRWKSDSPARFGKVVYYVAGAVVVGIAIGYTFIDNVFVLLATFIFIWILSHNIYLIGKKIIQKTNISFSFIGMILAHTGIGIFTLGATVVTQYGVEKDLSVKVGDIVNIAEYNIIFKGVMPITGPNYTGGRGIIDLYKDDVSIATLHPEKRKYATGMPMTEAAIDPSLLRDIYVSLGENLGNNTWTIRVYHKPLIRLIWLGGLFIALGGFIAAADARYRRREKYST